MNKKQIEQDIWNWITGYIEVNHKFYDYKFPPCPYAQGARMKGLVNVSAYESGSVIKFINDQADKVIDHPTYSINVLVFPAIFKYYFWIPWAVNRMNKRIIEQDYFAQYGTAIKTQSSYDEILKGKPYCIIIVNKLSTVIEAHTALLHTDYYKPWAKHHYEDVVLRRNRTYEEFKKRKQHEMDN